MCLPESNTEADAPLAAALPEGTIWYVTDPICSHCWALDPAWRKLLFHYGAQLAVRHIYGGLLPGWQGFSDAGAGINGPADVAPHWAEVAQHYGQPIDPSVWLTDPLDSSYPACVAAHAARMLDPEREDAYLRRIREAVFLEARNIARPEVLADCAADVGIDRDQFLAMFRSGAAEAAFRRDLQELRRLPVRGFPTLIIQGRAEQQAQVLSGTVPYAQLEAALLKVSGLARSTQSPTAEAALAAYGSGTTLEFAMLLGLAPAAAAEQLHSAGAHQTPIAGDALWSGYPKHRNVEYP